MFFLKMNFKYFINIWSLMFLFIFCASKLEAQRYVTWDDIKMNFDNIDISNGILRKSQGIIVVDSNGNGDSVTVQGAIDMVPDFNFQRIKILVRPGLYREKVFIPSSKPFISLIGNENHPGRTIITGNSKACDKDQYGNEIGTIATATVTVESDYFCATGITFENTVAALRQEQDKQGVALRLAGDKAMLYRVRILGSQDTLYDDKGSHYFFKCYIQGTVDFICGNARSLFQSCDLHSVAQDNVGISGAIAAHERESSDDDSGFSFVNCKVTGSGSVFLGRAWGEYSRIIYSKCYFDALIHPQGWFDWDVPSREGHAFFGEYNCKGIGANRAGRVPWSNNFTQDQVQPFLKRDFIGGDQWLRI